MKNSFFKKAQNFPVNIETACKKTSWEDDILAAKRLSLCSTPKAREIINYETARRFKVLPLSIIDVGNESRFTVAAAPYKDESERIKILKFCSNMQVQQISVKESILSEAQIISYLGDDALLNKNTLHAQAVIVDEEQVNDVSLSQSIGEVAIFLDGLIEYAVSHQASDIHLIPTVSGAILRLRINGEMRENRSAINSVKFHQQCILRLKVLANLNISKTFLPLDGVFKHKVGEKNISIRLSIMPTVHGEKAVLRLLAQTSLLTFDELGLNDKIGHLLKESIYKQEGGIIFSGPTGSGKTTSMYALLVLLRDRAKNIITIEDPVEMELDGVSQTSICEAQGLTYAECLKSVLRQDPDVVMVGELRQAEVVSLALNSALTGHLFFSTIHVRSVLDIPLRLAHFGADNSLIAQSLSILVSQRLIPRLCDKCKVIDIKSSNKYKVDVYQSVGCPACDYSGYAGRVIAVEALLFNNQIRNAISDNCLSAQTLFKIVSEENYLPFSDDFDDLLRHGVISAEHYEARQELSFIKKSG